MNASLVLCVSARMFSSCAWQGIPLGKARGWRNTMENWTGFCMLLDPDAVRKRRPSVQNLYGCAGRLSNSNAWSVSPSTFLRISTSPDHLRLYVQMSSNWIPSCTTLRGICQTLVKTKLLESRSGADVVSPSLNCSSYWTDKKNKLPLLYILPPWKGHKFWMGTEASWDMHKHVFEIFWARVWVNQTGVAVEIAGDR